jgi:hypothetical protein
MSKAIKKNHGSVANKRVGRVHRGEFSRIKIATPAFKLKSGEAEAIHNAVRNFYKRFGILEKV